ncbi:MAG TPA: tetratricopeptide repeat-containing serine protease family protein [Tepidisphaeraceae bacterium]|nr:tetratricopeptide repeat-containing serine protease family protein [Tepidisphaeraceae bacterium]
MTREGRSLSTYAWAICIIIVSLVARSTVLEIFSGRAALPAPASANVPSMTESQAVNQVPVPLPAPAPTQPAAPAPPPVVAIVHKPAPSPTPIPTVVKATAPPATAPAIRAIATKPSPPPSTTSVAAQAAVVSAPATRTPVVSAAPGPLTPDELFRAASPSVFVVEVTNAENVWSAYGSGFLVSSDGLLVTNYHVIRNGTIATIRTPDGQRFAVRGTVAVDPDSDLALLQTDLKDRPYLTLAADDAPAVGTRVYAIGSPLGLTNSLSDGLISGVRPNGKSSMLQTTAAISHGSSGGPLLTQDAKVVGVTSAMLVNGENLNLAVPVARVRQLIKSRGPLVPLALATTVHTPAEDSEIYSRLMNAVAHRRYDEAADILSADPNKNSAYFWVLSGWFQQTIENFGLAAEDYNRAIQLGQNDSRTYSLLGEALYGARRYDDAVNALRTAVKMDSDNIPAWEMAALCFQAEAEYSRAIEIVHRAMKIKPDEAGYYLILGISYQKLDQPASAVAAYQRYTDLKPNDPSGWCALGDMALLTRNYDGAESYFEKALTARPDWAYAYLELGQVRFEKRDVGAAEADWEAALRFDPNGPAGRAATISLRRAAMGD